MAVLIRTIIYASLFVALVLIYLPGQVLQRPGIDYPAEFGTLQYTGLLIGTVGALFALWCILTFTFVGKGTPAPFDPPRNLVVNGPYRILRNPMYAGAALALVGASLFYVSWPLVLYTVAFLTVTHLMVVFYEEPTLRRMFGESYNAYCTTTRRWGLF